MSTSDDRLKRAREQRRIGAEIRERAQDMQDKGYTNVAIADALGIRENSVRNLVEKPDIEEHEIIWFPGIYGGREYSPWTKSATAISIDHIIALVQRRAKQDGEWAIEHDFVGDNEDKMRRMMAWVSDETNIRQAVEAVVKEQEHAKKIVGDDYEPRTVDYVCRDLANASKWVVK